MLENFTSAVKVCSDILCIMNNADISVYSLLQLTLMKDHGANGVNAVNFVVVGTEQE